MYKEYLLFFIWVAPTIVTRFDLSRSLPSHSNVSFCCIMYYFADFLLFYIVLYVCVMYNILSV